MRTSLSIATCAGLMAATGAMAAQPVDGTIDTTFGFLGSGRALIAFDESAASPLDIARAAVADDEGRTYVVGTVQTNTGQQIGITRLLRDGSIDVNNYGDEGRVVAPAGALVSGVSAALDAQGFLLVGGTRTVSGSNTDFAVCRFSPGGALAAFPGNPNNLACVSVGFDLGGNNSDVLKDIAVQDDGKIVMVGDAGFSADLIEGAVVRLDSDGTLDSGFGVGGRQFFLAAGFQSHRLNAVRIAENGKIVVAGAAVANGTGHQDGLLARLTPAGLLDAEDFIDGGIETYNLNGASENFFNDLELGAPDVSFDLDQPIYAVGATETALDSERYFGWATYKLPNGTGTALFGDDGDLLINGGHDLVYSAVHRQADGKLILSGTRTATLGSDSDFRATRISGGVQGGVLDALTFNFPFGHINVDISQNNRQDTAFGMAVHPGRILVVGTTLTASPPPNLDFGVAALQIDRIFADGVELDD
jgi:uncharacterized delta-60 repeat protein